MLFHHMKGEADPALVRDATQTRLAAVEPATEHIATSEFFFLSAPGLRCSAAKHNASRRTRRAIGHSRCQTALRASAFAEASLYALCASEDRSEGRNRS